MRLLAETIYVALESESAQRGFLLTGRDDYLAPVQLAGAAIVVGTVMALGFRKR